MEEEGLVIIAVDIEGRGPSAVRNGIVSIGLCVYIPSKRNWEKHHINILPYPGQTMDEKCKAEFWDKQGDLLTVLQHQATTPNVAMNMFRDYIDQWPNVYLICDAPAYDFYFINYYLDREGLKLLQFDRDGDFRATHDGDSYARGLCRYGLDRQWISNADALLQMKVDTPITKYLRSHMPEDDAQAILETHIKLIGSVE